MKWKRIEAGHYKSQDGRFEILHLKRTGVWVLFDEQKSDETWSRSTYRSAKNEAHQILKREEP